MRYISLADAVRGALEPGRTGPATRVQPCGPARLDPTAEYEERGRSVDSEQDIPGRSDGPVFVDSTGRRGRFLRRSGWLLGLGCACYAVVLAVSMAGGDSTAPWLLIPGSEEETAETVQVVPSPVADAPSATGTPGDGTADPGTSAEPGGTDGPGATGADEATPSREPSGPGRSSGTTAAPSAPDGGTEPGTSASPRPDGPETGDGGSDGGAGATPTTAPSVLPTPTATGTRGGEEDDDPWWWNRGDR